MKKLLVLVLIVSTLTGCNGRNSALLQSCYHGIVGDSNSAFSIDKQDGKKVSGSMTFVFEQKDSSYGTYEGTFVNDKLIATYTFWSEGLQSVIEYEFIKNGKNFTGQGYIYKPSSDCSIFLKK